MKHAAVWPGENTLLEWAATFGIGIDADSARLMVAHLDWVLDTNRALNLTAVTDPLQALRLHVLDSLMALPEVEDAPGGLLLDIGTGAGFPGLPLALASRRETLLVDSVSKKTAALSRFLVQESLESWVSVSGWRSERIAREHGALASCVVARAVAELPVLVELAAPLLCEGGVLIAMKGSPDVDEVERGATAACRCGLTARAFRRYVLPAGGEARSIVTYERTGSPELELPRREGMAAKRPLG